MTGSGSVDRLEGARQVVVLGAGVSGTAATRALLGPAAGEAPPEVRVLDTRDTPPVRDAAAALRAAGAEVRLGVTDPADLVDADVVVASPGLSSSHPLLAGAAAAGMPVWSEPELAWRLAGGRTRLVSVTGTNGKTTTTELAAACLDAPAGGNLGPPLCDLLATAVPPPLVVAELSSFQLRYTDRLRSHVGVLLNVAPDHLDWHPDLADYEAAKARVWANQAVGDSAVVFVDDEGARRVRAEHPPPARTVEVTLAEPAEGQVGVVHGQLVSRLPAADAPVTAIDALATAHPAFVADAACAAAAALAAGASPAAVGARLAAARPGPHRLEQVAEVDGVRYVNDSKATNPHAAATALSAHPAVVWIAGGLNKGLDLGSLAPMLPGRVRAVVTVGRAADEVAAVAASGGVPSVAAGTVAAAVPAAASLARPGDVVLLSPACASMDQFRDYAQRGQAFRDAVAALAADREAAHG